MDKSYVERSEAIAFLRIVPSYELSPVTNCRLLQIVIPPSWSKDILVT